MISARQVKSLRARYGVSRATRTTASMRSCWPTPAHRRRPVGIVQPDSEETIALRMLVRARHDLIGHRIAVHNQLLAVLQHNFPGAIGLFSQLDIRDQSGVPAPVPERSQGRMALATADGVTGSRRTATAAVRPRPTGGPPATRQPPAGHRPAAEASELIVLTLVDLLTTLREQQTELEARIKEALLAHPDGPIFQSCHAPAPSAPRPCWPRSATAARASPTPQHSPPRRGRALDPTVRQHLNVAYRRGCNKHLRAALIDWAQDTPRANAWARDTYDRARDRGCRHPHAARILAQAWTRILGAAGTTTAPYNPDLHGRLSNPLQRCLT